MKFTSRKFILAAIGDIVGILTIIFGGNINTTVIGAVIIAVVNVAYCVVEGVIDAKRLGQIADGAKDIAQAFGASEQTVNVIGFVGDAAENIAEELTKENGGDAPDGEGK